MRLIAILTLVPWLAAQVEKPIQVKGGCTPDIVHEIGLDCSEEHPCPVFLELSAVEAVGNRILVSGNLHTSTTTLESILLSSEDGAKTWTEVHARLPQATIEAIQFFDFEVGWASGQVLHPRPRDAFFLITSDGGKTWRRRPVFSEIRTGTIDKFRFDSRTHGLLLIDRLAGSENGLRYELWESMTGGDSWSVRQVDAKPIAMQSASRAMNWRIRADAASNSLKLEREAAGKWQSSAAFAISAGECKPAAAELKPEPELQPEIVPAPKPQQKD